MENCGEVIGRFFQASGGDVRLQIAQGCLQFGAPATAPLPPPPRSCYGAPMSTLTEIEAAVETLPVKQQRKLLEHLTAKLIPGGTIPKPRPSAHDLMKDGRGFRLSPLRCATAAIRGTPFGWHPILSGTGFNATQPGCEKFSGAPVPLARF